MGLWMTFGGKKTEWRKMPDWRRASGRYEL